MHLTFKAELQMDNAVAGQLSHFWNPSRRQGIMIYNTAMIEQDISKEE